MVGKEGKGYKLFATKMVRILINYYYKFANNFAVLYSVLHDCITKNSSCVYIKHNKINEQTLPLVYVTNKQ